MLEQVVRSCASEAATVTFDAFRSFIELIEESKAAGKQVASGYQLIIICPDCGQSEAYRGRCPKCGGASWLPAGIAGGVLERMNIQRRLQSTRDEREWMSAA